jgi:uncharacterized protein (TIGR00725 family)
MNSRVVRLPVVGVMGSGEEPHARLARPLGRLVAERGCHLLTGGGGGVMAETARAFCAVEGRRGVSIGIIRSGVFPDLDPATGQRHHRPAEVNAWVELPILTHLPLSGPEGRDSLSRNHINVLTPDLVVVLPGGPGTLSEIVLAVEYERPLVLWLGKGTVDGLTAREIVDGVGGGATIRTAETLEDVAALLPIPGKP